MIKEVHSEKIKDVLYKTINIYMEGRKSANMSQFRQGPSSIKLALVINMVDSPAIIMIQEKCFDKLHLFCSTLSILLHKNFK